MRKKPEIEGNHRIISRLIGPEGEYFAELGDLENVFCLGLFGHYYAEKKRPKLDTIQKYIRGTAPFPRKVIRHYAGEHAELYLRQGIDRLLNACMCIDVLRLIQRQVAAYIASDAGVDQQSKDKISSYYIGDGADRAQIAAYLTCVMACIIPMM